MLQDLRDRARQMRNQPTPAEKRLWKYLSRSQLMGLKFRRQAPLDRFIVDFLCPAIALVVEVDGETHDLQRDSRRDAALAESGFTTIRFTNRDILSDIAGVLQNIASTASALPQVRPHPYPSPEGEGRSLH